MKSIIIILVLLIILIVGGLVFINSVLFDVAATKPETDIVKWVLQTTKEKSVRSRAREITVPNLDDESFLELGFSNFDQMCVGCHGAPGPTPLSRGYSNISNSKGQIVKLFSTVALSVT